MRKFRFTKQGIRPEPVRSHVTLGYGDRTLLGEVLAVVYTSGGSVRLDVRHFNGEPWPFQPAVREVSVLERT